MKNLIELSHPQKRILLTHLLYENSPVCNIGGYVCFRENLDKAQLKDALYHTVHAMDCMRLRLCRWNDEVMQFISDEKFQIEEIALEQNNQEEEQVRQVAKTLMESPFSLWDEPLFRIMVFSGDSGICGYILCVHHIIMDGWSIQLFAKAVSSFYEHRPVNFGSYLSFIEKEQAYINSERGNKDKFYWNNFVKKHCQRQNAVNTESESGGFREEFLIVDEAKKMLDEISLKYKGASIILAGCFLLMDYFRNGNGIIDLPNFNRTGHAMRLIGGMFTSTVLTAVEMNGEMPLDVLMEKVRHEINEGYRHQMWPYDMLELGNRAEPFRYSVNCYNTDLSQKINGLVGEYHEVYPGAQALPFQVILKTWGERYSISFDMRKDYYRTGDGMAFYLFFKEYLNSLCINPQITVKEFKKKLAFGQRVIQNGTFRAEPVLYDRLEVLLENILVRGKEPSIAIYMESGSVTRDELMGMVAGAINKLKKEGVEKGSRLVMWLPNSLEYIVYVYAAVFMGVTFIPVDSSYPERQICYILKDAAADFMVSDKPLRGIRNISPSLIYASVVKPAAIDEKEIAYILYTSGTTGSPKGVMVSRRALSAYLGWASLTYGQETFFMYSSPSFDLSVTTLFLPVITGGRIVMASPENANLYRMPSMDIAAQITAIKGTPSNFSLLLKHDTSKLKLKAIICGGEELTVPLALELQKRFGKSCRIYNEYGPTECTVGCMCHLFSESDIGGKAVPVGKAAPGTRVYVLDENMELCIAGKSGEIYLAGVQLAEGYWNLPDENKSVFSYHTSLGERIYKTGDLGRYDIDGNVEYLGRIGRQRKVNGFRVELDGIERVIKSVADVRNAVVWVYKQKIIAVVEVTRCTEQELVNAILKELPKYCVPHQFVLLEKLPYTINGKVDIKELEERIASDWQEKFAAVSNYKNILEIVIRDTFHYSGDIHAFNYLSAGGDSITALRVTSAIAQYGLHISLADILDNPEFDDMANYVKQQEGKTLLLGNSETLVLPEYLKYLAKTCSNFSQYRHTMVLKIDRTLKEDDAELLSRQLRIAYPITGMKYADEKIISSVEKPAFQIKKMNAADQELFLDRWIRWMPDEEQKDLLYMDILSCEDYSLLRINAHHLIVDGTSWYRLFKAVSDILNRKRNYQKPIGRAGWSASPIEYTWDSYQAADSAFVQENADEYKVYSATMETAMEIDEGEYLEMIKDAVFSLRKYADDTLLYDRNGRTYMNGSQTEGLACYSIMIPVVNRPESAQSQIQSAAKAKKIHIVGEKCIRVNFMGHIEELFQETGFGTSTVYLRKCIEQNLYTCSGYGCDFEITAWLSENPQNPSKETLNVYITSRLHDLDGFAADCIFESMEDECHKISARNQFWNEYEEQQMLNEIEGNDFL